MPSCHGERKPRVKARVGWRWRDGERPEHSRSCGPGGRGRGAGLVLRHRVHTGLPSAAWQQDPSLRRGCWSPAERWVVRLPLPSGRSVCRILHDVFRNTGSFSNIVKPIPMSWGLPEDRLPEAMEVPFVLLRAFRSTLRPRVWEPVPGVSEAS